jgi:hypothetical protein
MTFATSQIVVLNSELHYEEPPVEWKKPQLKNFFNP